MKNAIISTLLHTLVVATALFVAVILVRLLGVDSESVTVAVGLVLVALEKFLRASPNVPINDFVNDR